MTTEKKFYRVKLSDKFSGTTKIVEGITLTKQWQIKTGEPGNLTNFSDIDVEIVIKQGNAFVPDSTASAKSSDSSAVNDISRMNAGQLRTHLISIGQNPDELQNLTRKELLERAESVTSQTLPE